MGLQKHEQQAITVMMDVADLYGVAFRKGEIRNNKHPTNVVFQHGDSKIVVGIPSSPRDKTWLLKMAGKRATTVCRNLLNGVGQPPVQHL